MMFVIIGLYWVVFYILISSGIEFLIFLVVVVICFNIFGVFFYYSSDV